MATTTALMATTGGLDIMSGLFGMSAASAAQSTSVNEVGLAVAQMEEGTQQNAALVEEAAAAARSLNHEAAQLVRAVSVFKT